MPLNFTVWNSRFGGHIPPTTLCHLWKQPKKRAKICTFLPRFLLIFCSKTTIYSGYTLLFALRTTIRHHYYRFNVPWIDNNDVVNWYYPLGGSSYFVKNALVCISKIYNLNFIFYNFFKIANNKTLKKTIFWKSCSLQFIL